MMTLLQFSNKPETVPAITSWYLSDLGEARGKKNDYKFPEESSYMSYVGSEYDLWHNISKIGGG
jgi:hypothetical protein